MSRNIRRDKFRLLRRVVQKATERNRVGRMTISHKRPLPSQRCLNCPLVKLRARAVRREAVRRGVVFSVYVSQDPGLPSLGEAAQQSAALAVRRYQVRVATAVNAKELVRDNERIDLEDARLWRAADCAQESLPHPFIFSYVVRGALPKVAPRLAVVLTKTLAPASPVCRAPPCQSQFIPARSVRPVGRRVLWYGRWRLASAESAAFLAFAAW